MLRDIKLPCLLMTCNCLQTINFRLQAKHIKKVKIYTIIKILVRY